MQSLCRLALDVCEAAAVGLVVLAACAVLGAAAGVAAVVAPLAVLVSLATAP